MPHDHVLSFHRVDDDRFELSGLRTGSIRDQVLRAQLLSERLLGTNKLAPGKSLLVIGGGACGATLALCAARLGVNVTLVEKESTPFATQAKSERWLHPNEYDWPHSHYYLPDMDWHRALGGTGPNRYALAFTAMSAKDLAAQWTLQWNLKANATPRGSWGAVDFISNTDARTLRIYRHPNGGVVAPGLANVMRGTTTFDVAVSCVGFIDERVSVPNSRGHTTVDGPKFWGTDNLAEDDLGTGRPGPLNVVVSGSGDGAQQDVQRILTGRYGLDLLREFESAGLLLPPSDALQLALADDAGRRSHIWSNPQSRNELDLIRWDVDYQHVAEKTITAAFKVGSGVDTARLARLIRTHIELKWVVQGRSLSFGFALNKYLTHLILELYCQLKGRHRTAPLPSIAIFLMDHQVADVSSADGHHCGGACYNQQHHVDLLNPAGSLMRISPVDILVIRHGVEQTPFFGPAPVSEQLIPYYAPN